MNKSKKILSIVAAATLAFSAVAFSGCGSDGYKGETLTADASLTTTVSSNGGFAVETKDYVYFVNGKETNTADNTYGTPLKGALMRISKADLAAKKYDTAKVVIPSLFVSGDYDAGIYIYNGYIYYATPTTDKNLKGEVENSWIDFKCSKLDGSEAPMNGKNDYFFRLSSSAAKFRFVEVNKTVYCMYEENSQLKSYNTKTGDTTVLVSGAKSSFYYNTEDASDAYAYYTMAVTYDIESDNPTTATYDQVYCVRADATAEFVSESGKVGYKVKDGNGEVATYKFDKAALEEDKIDVKDYSAYPYVNLGRLVLDGVGKSSKASQYNKDALTDSSEPLGYTYTIQNYTGSGLYFTRTAGVKTSSETENTKLYYIPHARTAEWNTVKATKEADIVALDTTNASASAIYDVAEDGTHSYIYVSGTKLCKATVNEEGEATVVDMAYDVASGTTLWKTEGDYLYFYGAGINGNNLSLINYTGSQDDYKKASFEKELGAYDAYSLPSVDWNDSWYDPELVTLADGSKVVLYANAQSFGAGTTSYDYIYAAKVGTVAEIKASNETLDKIRDEIDSYSDNSALQAVMKYYALTGETKAFDAVKGEDKGLYTDYQRTTFDAFKAKFATGGEYEGLFASHFINCIGRMTDADKAEIDQSWADSLLSEKEEEATDTSWPTWAIVVLAVFGTLAVAAMVTVPLYLNNKKKKEQKKEQDAIVNAYKRQNIDTTDDKSIDVYADEEEPAEEVVEETEATETVEEIEATVVEVEAAEEATTEEVAAEPVIEEAEVIPEATEAPVEETAAPEAEVAPEAPATEE